jgi:hypothetical protein
MRFVIDQHEWSAIAGNGNPSLVMSLKPVGQVIRCTDIEPTVL